MVHPGHGRTTAVIVAMIGGLGEDGIPLALLLSCLGGIAIPTAGASACQRLQPHVRPVLAQLIKFPQLVHFSQLPPLGYLYVAAAAAALILFACLSWATLAPALSVLSFVLLVAHDSLSPLVARHTAGAGGEWLVLISTCAPNTTASCSSFGSKSWQWSLGSNRFRQSALRRTAVACTPGLITIFTGRLSHGRFAARGCSTRAPSGCLRPLHRQ